MAIPHAHSTRGASLLILLALTACVPDQSDAEAEKPRPVRTVAAVATEGGEEVVQTGEVRPHEETGLGFMIAGRIATRAVSVGAMVKKGQVLATLYSQDVANEVRAAEADLRSAQSSEALAKIARDRQHLLLEKQVAAQAKVEEADSNWQTALAHRDSAVAALENARHKLSYANLIATEDGTITAIGANPGQVVAAGQMVVTLASALERDAVFNVSEKLVNSVSPDVKVTVSLVSEPSIHLVGSLRDVSPTADAATRSYRVRIALPDAPPDMNFGATVSGKILLPGERLFALPASALTSEANSPAVYIVDPTQAKLQRRIVTISRYTAEQIFVSAGVTPGDRIVVAGVSKLRPGQAVALPNGADK